MPALHKVAAYPVMLLASLAASAAYAQQPADIGMVAEAATKCVLAANKEGADTSKFDNAKDWAKDWTKDDDGGFSHDSLAIRITFPADNDGVSRNCVVHATLKSQKDQSDLLTAFEVLLKQKPIKQSDNILWIFGKAPNARGLQAFPDTTSEKPKIRLIGAAF